MTRPEWLLAGQFLLDAHGITDFRAYEIANVGRRNGSATLQAPPPHVAMNAVELIRHGLLWIRNHLGDAAPVHVNSWYRDPQYNEAVGGATKSIHLVGGAADINKEGWTPAELASAIHRTHPLADELGIGLYRSFVHVDIRGIIGRRAPARWQGDGVPPGWWQ